MKEMNLRVLIYMNPMAVDKISKKFLYEKDSGFLFIKQLLQELPDEWAYYILLPKEVKVSFFEANNKTIIPVFYDYSTSIHQNRYHFNRNILANLLPYGTDIDVVINNQPEVSANIRVFFENQRRESPIIINYFHWIDCVNSAKYAKELSGFIWRQLDGVINSDLSCFHGEYARNLFNESCKSLGVDMNIVNYNYGYFHPKATVFGIDEFDLPNKKIILFNHRLNNSTGWRSVLEICDDLYKKRDDFVLWFTDEDNLQFKKEAKKYDFLIIKRLPYRQYGHLIKNSHFSICNTSDYATWNMAVLDSSCNGCLPVVPNDTHDIYKNMFGDFGYYHDYKNLKNIINELLDTTKSDVDLINSKITVLLHKNYNIKEFIYKKILSKIEGKNITKFDSVITMIAENSNVLKKDFVNKLWAFHANSNFQLIRWKLLSSGIYDDIHSHETLYSKDSPTWIECNDII